MIGSVTWEDIKEDISEAVTESSSPSSSALSLHTTIAGVKFSEGIVLGTDTLTTEGSIMTGKNSKKIHHLARNIQACGAGTAADTEYVIEAIASRLELLRLATDGNEVRVAAALTMLQENLLKYQDHVGAALVLGGVDVTGTHLFTVYPHGSADEVPFTSMGSGSLATMGVLEREWRPQLTRDEAVDVILHAMRAGIFNDHGSGSNVDVCVITRERGAELTRSVEMYNRRRLSTGYPLSLGTTKVTAKRTLPRRIDTEDETVSHGVSSARQTKKTV